ncbi:hypothetical protein TYRP_009268 [Tyrophagus putrescentiae]|nr:hypothetical protein TYRP_009268 [Tyrophagus putrescentiae]
MSTGKAAGTVLALLVSACDVAASMVSKELKQQQTEFSRQKTWSAESDDVESGGGGGGGGSGERKVGGSLGGGGDLHEMHHSSDSSSSSRRTANTGNRAYRIGKTPKSSSSWTRSTSHSPSK